jgi:cell division initiation protein
MMISAKELTNKKFEKSALGGYKIDEVDQFLRDLAMDVSQLQKEKDDCEKKIDVLADKVREYMKDEDALKDALLGAQRQGHKVIEDSQMIANKIMAEANENADKIINQTRMQHESEKSALAKIQKEVSDFKAKLLTLYKSHLDLITAMPDVDDYDLIDENVSDEKVLQQEADVQTRAEQNTNESKKNNYPFSNSISKNNESSHYSDLKFGHNSK